MFFKSNKNLSLSEFEKIHAEKGGIIVDCRTPGECAAGTLSGAIQADWLGGELPKKSVSWNKSAPVFCYCRSGARSGAAVQFLKSNGFEEVYNLGGYSSLV